mmetsp:Transcript_6642/g.12601  ORF Transcript_6642/g.12601 Transcript_6642/m.12601 type:complete len:213 (-) Transcript_6642:772-1410(-)
MSLTTTGSQDEGTLINLASLSTLDVLSSSWSSDVVLFKWVLLPASQTNRSPKPLTFASLLCMDVSISSLFGGFGIGAFMVGKLLLYLEYLYAGRRQLHTLLDKSRMSWVLISPDSRVQTSSPALHAIEYSVEFAKVSHGAPLMGLVDNWKSVLPHDVLIFLGIRPHCGCALKCLLVSIPSLVAMPNVVWVFRPSCRSRLLLGRLMLSVPSKY